MSLQHTKILKIVKKNSVSYFCEENNTSYSKKEYLLNDFPNIDLVSIEIVDLRKIEQKAEDEIKELFSKALKEES